MENKVDTRLKQYIENIERIELDKKEMADSLTEVYADLKSQGFDIPTVKKIVKLRKQDLDKRAEEASLLDTYAKAVQLELF